jgi:hypothetical protein
MNSCPRLVLSGLKPEENSFRHKPSPKADGNESALREFSLPSALANGERRPRTTPGFSPLFSWNRSN